MVYHLFLSSWYPSWISVSLLDFFLQNNVFVVFCHFDFGIVVMIFLLVWHPFIVSMVFLLFIVFYRISMLVMMFFVYFLLIIILLFCIVIFSIIIWIVIFVRHNFRIVMVMGLFIIVWFPIGIININRLIIIILIFTMKQCSIFVRLSNFSRRIRDFCIFPLCIWSVFFLESSLTLHVFCSSWCCWKKNIKLIYQVRRSLMIMILLK